MNYRKDIINRNREYLKKYFDLTEEQWLALMRNVGKPENYGEDWSINNPTRGWCGGVNSALRLSGKIPEGFVACRNKIDSHFYMVNPKTNEVIDLTIYQINGEYGYDYFNYHQKFMNVLSKNVSRILNALDLKIDKSKYTLFEKNKKNFIKKVKY
jgi:hypothetical protein